jgi:ABC-2 type transport system permease protein
MDVATGAAALSMTGAALEVNAMRAQRDHQVHVSPWRTLLQHEWRMLRAGTTARLMLLLYLSACAVGLWSGTRWTHNRAEAIDTARRADDGQRDRWLRFVDTVTTPPDGPFARDPRMPMFVAGTNAGTIAGLDLLPLAALSVGQSDLLPTQHRIAIGTRESVLGVTEVENPANLLTGRFDLAFVLVALLPLVILALSYNMVSGEQEDGTLALALAQPISMRSLLLSKVLVRALLIVGLTIGTVVVGALVSRTSMTAGDDLARLVWWCAVAVIYAMFWFGLAMVMTLKVRSSAASAMMLAATWLAITVVVPSLTNTVAQTVHPAPSRVALIGAMRSATNEANAASDKVLAKFAFDHPEMRPDTGAIDMRNFWNVSLSVTDTVEKQLAPFYTAFDAQAAEQQALVRRAALASPAMLVQQAFETMSGTNPERWMAFRAQVVDFHRQWQSYFAAKQLKGASLTRNELAALPRFRFMEPGFSATMRQVAPMIGYLVLLTALIWVVALRAARSYRVVGA